MEACGDCGPEPTPIRDATAEVGNQLFYARRAQKRVWEGRSICQTAQVAVPRDTASGPTQPYQLISDALSTLGHDCLPCGVVGYALAMIAPGGSMSCSTKCQSWTIRRLATPTMPTRLDRLP